MAWLEVLHALATTAWVAGLTAVAVLDRRGAAERPRPLYRRLTAPAAYLALLTGIWLLHREPRLLRSGVMAAKLGCVALLGVVDHACQRGLGRHLPWLSGAAVTLGVACGALAFATPGEA